jgi:ribosomal protein L40E
MDLKERQWEFELKRREQELEAKRRQEKLDHIARQEDALRETIHGLEMKRRQMEAWADNALQAARVQAEISQIRLKVRRARLDLALLAVERLNEIDRKDSRERELFALRTERERLDLRLAEAQSKLDMRLQERQVEHRLTMEREKQRQDFELSRIDRLSRASVEVVMSLSEPEQARIIADLKETEALRGLTDVQVEAKMASRSPEFAEALSERWKSLADKNADTRERALYERLLQQKTEEGERIIDILREIQETQSNASAMQQQTAREGMRFMKETATSFARTRGAAKSTVAPPFRDADVGKAGTHARHVADSAARSYVCSHCGHKSPDGASFCTKCGDELADSGV